MRELKEVFLKKITRKGREIVRRKEGKRETERLSTNRNCIF